MSKQLSSTLIALAVLLIIVGIAEHLFFRVEVVPHLALALGAVAVVIGAIGVYGFTRRPAA